MFEEIDAKNLLEKHKNRSIRHVLDPIIPYGGVSILAGERGTGKTRFALSLACSIAAYKPSFLSLDIHEHGGVLYLNFESKELDISLFLRPIFNHYSKGSKIDAFDKLVFLNFWDEHEYTFDVVARQIALLRPKLVIIDTLKAFVARLCQDLKIKEINNSNILELYGVIKRWREYHPEVTFLILNHTNKGTSKESSHSDLMWGPSSLMDYADATFLLRKAKEPQQRILVPDKLRHSQEGEIGASLIEMMSNDEELWFELLEENIHEQDHIKTEASIVRFSMEFKLSAVRAHLKEDKSLSQVAEEFLHDPKKKGTISKWVRKFRSNIENE